VLEDETNHEIPNIHLFYRQARQMVYGILFNLHHAYYLAKSNSSQKGILLDVWFGNIFMISTYYLMINMKNFWQYFF